MNSFVAIDFETANYKSTSICSVGLVFVENKKIVDKFYSLVKPTPNYYIPEFVNIHGINYYDTLNADTFDVVWQKIVRKVGNLPFVAHNKSFDYRCLKSTLDEYNIPHPKNEFNCSLIRSRKVVPFLKNHKLPTVSKHFGFDLINHHNAIADAEACAVISINVF